jgi:P27 family predicted phage terminase small subunit
MKTKGVTPPAGLSEAALAWWDRLMHDYEDWGASDLLLLEAALQAYSRWQQARTAIDAEGLTVRDRFDQVHAHPACGVERDSRAAMQKALSELGLEAPDAQDKPSSSELGRRAAMARWQR